MLVILEKYNHILKVAIQYFDSEDDVFKQLQDPVFMDIFQSKIFTINSLQYIIELIPDSFLDIEEEEYTFRIKYR